MLHTTNNDDLLTPESLSVAQESNLVFLENIGLTVKVGKIPIGCIFTYEFIQILNNMYLETILNDVNVEVEDDERNDEWKRFCFLHYHRFYP